MITAADRFSSRRATVSRMEAMKMGWSRLTRGGVELHEMPGDHPNILVRPQAETLAEKLRKYMAEYQAEFGRADTEMSVARL